MSKIGLPQRIIEVEPEETELEDEPQQEPAVPVEEPEPVGQPA